MTQMLQKETPMDKLVQDSILCSFLWSGITKDTLILMATCLRNPIRKSVWTSWNTNQNWSIEYWENEVEGLKEDQDGLNEFYRQFPRTTKHAFRDESKMSLFNLTKIYQQIDYNEEATSAAVVTRGSFQWENGIKDTRVIFHLIKTVDFYNMGATNNLQNRFIIKNGIKYPGNEHMGAFGCDSYDISGTVDGRGSKGALHGLTKFSMEDAPADHFFLEYIARPQTAEIFFEDVLMACIFYGMPILAENNKPRLLYHFKRRGYRGLAMNRPDKVMLNYQ